MLVLRKRKDEKTSDQDLGTVGDASTAAAHDGFDAGYAGAAEQREQAVRLLGCETGRLER